MTDTNAPDRSVDERIDAELHEFEGLVKRLISRRPFPVAAAAPTVAAGLTWGALTGTKASAQTTFPIAYDQTLVRLVNRCCGGFLLSEYNTAVSQGFATYLANQLAYDPANDTAVNNYIAADPTTLLALLTNTGTVPNDLINIQPAAFVWAQQLQLLTLMRRMLSSGHLYESAVEFWSNHFSIDVRDKSGGISKPFDDRDVVRPCAFDRFPAMLLKSAFSPSMLVYLDNWNNKKPTYQENYARELMELHTLGVNSLYSEQDIKDAAACLAGHTIELAAGPGQFLYKWDNTFHDSTPSYNLLTATSQNLPIAAGGATQATVLLSGLAAHPDTEKYIASKVALWLLGYSPTPAQLTAIENAYSGSSGGIKPMIQAALTQSNLSPANAVLKLKRPAQLAVTLLRSVNGVLASPTVTPFFNPMLELINELAALGHAPHSWGPPNGYPDNEAAWAGGVLGRWALVDKIMNNAFAGLTVNYVDLVNLLGNFTIPQTAVRMNDILGGQNLTQGEMNAIQSYVNFGVGQIVANNMSVEDVVRELFAVTASAPSYQYY